MNEGRVRILFQGDSITDAFRRPEEVNPAFQLGNGYAFLVSAKLAMEHPAKFSFFNRGISGHTVQDLAARWEQDAMALSPDVLSLLIGVNDTIREMIGEGSASVSAFENEYRSLLNRMLAKNPECLLILMEPFLLRAGSVNEAWIQHLQDRQKVVRHLAEEFGALFVPCQSAMDAVLHRAPAEEWAYDGIHPTHAGAAVLAEAWDTVAGIAVKACLE